MNTFIKKNTPILIHTLIWVLFLIIDNAYLYFRIGKIIPQDFIIRFFLLIAVFYVNYFFFVPKLLLNKKIYLYLLVSVGTGIFFIFTIAFFIPTLSKELSLITNNTHKVPLFFETFLKNFSIGSMVFLITALSTGIRLAIEWYKIEKQKEVIENQKINSELSFLKAQLNPHFLFNSLNSIYSLAHKQSNDTTNAIVMLSELMRYMIYETNKELVPLQKEIDYIKNYIALQLLRLKDSSGVKVNIHGSLHYKIEPLLLISFIENAFKYGTDFKGNTQVIIKITIKEEYLHLYVCNPISYYKTKKDNSGVGLENIKNRLRLLYKNKHTLTIDDSNNTYKVNVTIKLKK